MSDFTYQAYITLLNFIKQKGYRIGTLREFPETGPALILRHDIDFSISHALKMAHLDTSLNICSSFFVLLTSPFYNAFSDENIQMLKEIHHLGHEIGLHYDCSSFENINQQHMRQHISQQISLLETVLGIKIFSISQHKPATSKIRPHFPEFRDAYDPKYTTEIAYLSDSRMRLGTSNIQEFFNQNKRSQLLIHPIWWNEESLSRKEIFNNLKFNISTSIERQVDHFHESILTYLKLNNALTDFITKEIL